MRFWNNIFATAYQYYGRFKNQSERFTAACVVSLCIMMLIFLSIILVSKAIEQNLIAMALPNKYYALPFILLLMFFVNRYYTPTRVDLILSKFNALSCKKREVWKLLTVLFVVVPIIIIAFLLKK